MTALGDFLEEQRKKSQLSWRKFGEQIGVSHSMLLAYVKGESVPSWDTLLTISRSLSYDILTLIAMAYPDDVHQPDTNVVRLAQAISDLPHSQRIFLWGLIESGLLQNLSEVSKESNITLLE